MHFFSPRSVFSSSKFCSNVGKCCQVLFVEVRGGLERGQRLAERERDEDRQQEPGRRGGPGQSRRLTLDPQTVVFRGEKEQHAGRLKFQRKRNAAEKSANNSWIVKMRLASCVKIEEC